MSSIFLVLLLVVIGLSIYHFIWSSIIMPTFRQLQRNNLFSLRDDLRSLLLQNSISEEEFDIVHNIINYSLNNLSKLQLTDVIHFRNEYKKNPEFRRLVDQETARYESFSNEQINRILDETAEVCRKVCYLNSGGWVVYLVPVLLSIVFARNIKRLALKFTAHYSLGQNKSGYGLPYQEKLV